MLVQTKKAAEKVSLAPGMAQLVGPVGRSLQAVDACPPPKKRSTPGNASSATRQLLDS